MLSLFAMACKPFVTRSHRILNGRNTLAVNNDAIAVEHNPERILLAFQLFVDVERK